MTSVELRDAIPEIEISNVSKYMHRAKRHGFVTHRKMGNENLWRIVPGWDSKKPMVEPQEAPKIVTTAANSVWSLAAQ